MSLRNSFGFTLPFALILTFIFSALVGVSFLFVSLNLRQMYSHLQSMQATSVAEGINERIKARLNTKSKIQPSPEQEEKLQSSDEFEDELEDDDFFEEEAFDESTDIYDEYYADEVIKISRFITFREPPEGIEMPIEGAEDTVNRPEANVEMIGSIDIPRGTILQKGTKIVIFKDEKLSLELEDVVPEETVAYRNKLPAPIVKSLSPNYGEANARGTFTVIGENLSYDHKARFNNKDITIENIKAGPFVEYLISEKIMPGLTYFFWETARSEFYVIPPYDGSPKPVLSEIKLNGEQLLDVKAGQRGVVLKIYGADLFLNKSLPVVIPDISGIIPKVKDKSLDGKEITVTLTIENKVEPGVHTLSVATEGGISNTWLFNILPPEEGAEQISAKTATYTSSLTLLDVKVVESLLPLIDEGETPPEKQASPEDSEDEFDEEEGEEEEAIIDEEVPETEKLSPYANTDLETVWLLETSTMVGKITKTISEVVQRVIPNITAGLITNGKVEFSGGGFSIIGSTSAMTVLTEPTYILNTTLTVPGPPEEDELREGEEAPPSMSPLELGFRPGGLVAVYQEGKDIDELDYGIIKTVGENTIDLMPPGLMGFHYGGDVVYQFNPAVISGEAISQDEAKKHIAPPGFALKIPKAADFKRIFMANHEGYSELADFYSKDGLVPSDEFGIPIGYMDLAYVEGTPSYGETSPLLGKGILVIDTRGDNLGEPTGNVEINGESRNPADFTGIIYVHGNLMISGTVNINGAVIVDNESRGKVEISSEALGMISYSDAAIRQVLLSVPFTTFPGTIMISNKPLNLGDYVQSGERPVTLGAAPSEGVGTEGKRKELEETKVASSEIELVEAEIKPKTPDKLIGVSDLFGPSIPPTGGRKSAEEELIDLF